jgi:hypothetical protein
MVTHQFHPGRLRELEGLLEIEYEIAYGLEKEISLSVGHARIIAKARLERDVAPRLRKLEEEYAQLVARELPDGVPGDTTNHWVEDLSQAVAVTLEAAPPDGPEETLRLLREINAKLSDPKMSAAAKLKFALPLIPGVCSYETEIGAAAGIRSIWNMIRGALGRLVVSRPH